MFKIEWEKNSLDSFYKKMDNLVKKLPESAKLGVNDALKNTQETALKNKRGSRNEKLIPIEIVDFNKYEVVGRVYTNKDLFSYAPFLEYGTGTEAELPHIGKTKTFILSGFRYWFLPVEKVDRQFSPERIINIDGSLFYLMFATRPYPFMRPASMSTRQENADLVNERIGRLLMEVLK